MTRLIRGRSGPDAAIATGLDLGTPRYGTVVFLPGFLVTTDAA